MIDTQAPSKEVSIYDIDAPLELPAVMRRDERDFPARWAHALSYL
jgi:hypothetical protein